MNEDKSSRYHRLRRRASFVSTVLGVLLLLGLVVSGGSAALRHTAASLVGGSFLLTLSCYVVLLALISEAISLPFAFYQGVTLERRYGLSTQTTVSSTVPPSDLIAFIVAVIEPPVVITSSINTTFQPGLITRSSLAVKGDGYFYRSVGSTTAEAVQYYLEHSQRKHWTQYDYETESAQRTQARLRRGQSTTGVHRIDE